MGAIPLQPTMNHRWAPLVVPVLLALGTRAQPAPQEVQYPRTVLEAETATLTAPAERQSVPVGVLTFDHSQNGVGWITWDPVFVPAGVARLEIVTDLRRTPDRRQTLRVNGATIADPDDGGPLRFCTAAAPACPAPMSRADGLAVRPVEADFGVDPTEAAYWMVDIRENEAGQAFSAVRFVSEAGAVLAVLPAARARVLNARFDWDTGDVLDGTSLRLAPGTRISWTVEVPDWPGSEAIAWPALLTAVYRAPEGARFAMEVDGAALGEIPGRSSGEGAWAAVSEPFSLQRGVHQVSITALDEAVVDHATISVSGLSEGAASVPDPTDWRAYAPLAPGDVWHYRSTPPGCPGSTDCDASVDYKLFRLSATVDDEGQPAVRRTGSWLSTTDVVYQRTLRQDAGLRTVVEAGANAPYSPADVYAIDLPPTPCPLNGPGGVSPVCPPFASAPYHASQGITWTVTPDDTVVIGSDTLAGIPTRTAEVWSVTQFRNGPSYAPRTLTYAAGLGLVRQEQADGWVDELVYAEIGGQVTGTPAWILVASEDAPEAAEDALRVGPNPTAGRVRIGLASSAPVEARVTVLDALGRQVLPPRDVRLGAASTSEVDLSRLGAGVYVVRVETAAAVRSHLVTRL